MEELIFYSIRLKRDGSFWIYQSYFNESSDYQVAFRKVSLRNDNGLFDLLLFKGGEEVDYYDFNGWEIRNSHYSFSWGKSTIKAELKDCTDETQEIVLVSVDAGTRTNWVPSPEWLLEKAICNIQKITKTYASIEMYNLCEQSYINFKPMTLVGYFTMLNKLSDFCQKAEKIRNYIKSDPKDPDKEAYESKLKPKIIEYMKTLSEVKFNPDKLNP